MTMRFGNELMRQADVLAGMSEDAPRVTRTYLSPQHKQAGDYLIGLMQRAGMTAGFDALGNIVGRYEAADPGAPVVMTGQGQGGLNPADIYKPLKDDWLTYSGDYTGRRYSTRRSRFSLASDWS